jgi:membrane protease YdiL (CAAX protease family)
MFIQHMSANSRKRPWLAAILSTLAAGLGHLYLRRWRRALGWILLVFAATYLVGPETLTAYQAGNANIWDIAPILTTTAGAAFDAYVVARVENLKLRTKRDKTDWATCPNCRKDIDPSLDFCQWCAADFSTPEDDANADSGQ